MKTHLGAVDRRLMWEYGPALGSRRGHRLVITPEANVELRPLVDLLLARAPRIAGFQFLAQRPAEGLKALGDTLEGRTGRGAPPMRILVEPEGDAISLTYFVEGCTGGDDEDANATAFVTSEVMLGEEALSTRWHHDVGRRQMHVK